MMRKNLVDVAFERGIIRDKEPFLHEETNRTRRSVREARSSEPTPAVPKITLKAS